MEHSGGPAGAAASPDRTGCTPDRSTGLRPAAGSVAVPAAGTSIGPVRLAAAVGGDPAGQRHPAAGWLPRLQQARWSTRVHTWEHTVGTSEGFAALRREVLERAAAAPGEACVDLGAGTGFLSLPLARTGADVLAVDLAVPMLARLSAAAAEEGLVVATRAADLATLSLPAGSVDVVVSSYALHHLRHADKRALLARVATWLRPGGRLVVADMMFGHGLAAEDRQIARAKIATLARRGLPGWWRIARNVVRFSTGLGSERPAPSAFWVSAFQDAGFVDVSFTRVVAEAGVVSGRIFDREARQP